MTPFEQLSYDEQIKRLQQLGREALARYGIQNARMEFLGRRKRLVSVTRRVVYATLEAVQAKLMVSVGKVINTAFIERLNLMLRQRVPALARRTLAVAKNEVGLEQELNLRRGYYNFVVPHGSLRQRLPESNDSDKVWQQRTPAMAAGITDHLWTMEQLLRFRAPPWRQTIAHSLAI